MGGFGVVCWCTLSIGCAGPSLTMRSDAMAPTIKTGATLTLDSAAYNRRDPARFDIVLLAYQPVTGVSNVQAPPAGAEISYRIVGLPGEHVEVRSDGVRINGSLLQMPRGLDYRPAPKSPDYTRFNEVVLPEDGYFVLGDNTALALDSRYWGWVARGNILGRIRFE